MQHHAIGSGNTCQIETAGQCADVHLLSATIQCEASIGSDQRQACLEWNVSQVTALERISKKPFGLRSGISHPCVVVEDLTEHPTMLGFDA